jgi:hypothetical protein
LLLLRMRLSRQGVLQVVFRDWLVVRKPLLRERQAQQMGSTSTADFQVSQWWSGWPFFAVWIYFKSERFAR